MQEMYVCCGKEEENRRKETENLTFPNLSFSTLRKSSLSLKWSAAHWPFFNILRLNFPRHSIIERSIWLFERPVKRILPVHSSKSVQPTDHISIVYSKGMPSTRSKG